MIFAGVIGGAPPATLIGTTDDTVARTSSYTFAGVDFGPDYSGRTIFVVAHLWNVGATTLDQTSVTIGGQAATGGDNGEFGDGSPDGTAGVGIWAAQPTGTSGTVVINFTSGHTSQGCSISVIAVPDLSSITAHATYAVPGNGDGRASQSGSINIPANGFLIMGLTRVSTSALTFTGATEAVDSVFDTNARKGVAFDEGLSLQANRPVGWSSSGTIVSAYIARSYA